MTTLSKYQDYSILGFTLGSPNFGETIICSTPASPVAMLLGSAPGAVLAPSAPVSAASLPASKAACLPGRSIQFLLFPQGPSIQIV